ncbi:MULTISPECIES: S24 family peptidase [Sphingomonas]|uniref:SOS-response transcriptional repressor LexA n=3 Tax=Sphingomonas TaxID=13687 RepID=A0A7X5Y4P3_9SPHN|nr:S24 family peptidase [Sphingomonas sp. ABOLD]NJB99411.1 SOS-response transcriptional repressor LexA [Sphingomonas trueperi]
MAASDAVFVSNSQATMLDQTSVAVSLALFDTPNTMAEPKPPVYRALMALKPDGLALGRWATDAGLARNYFNGLEKHGNPSQDVVDALLSAISATRADYERSLEHAKQTDSEFVLSEVVGIARGSRDTRMAIFGDEPLPPVPLVGSAIGGDFGSVEEHIELTELYYGQVLDYVSRPDFLAKDPQAYALRIVGESMVPALKPGHEVWVSPREGVGIGDTVIVQLRGGTDQDQGVKMVLVKELVRRSSEYVELRQYNPPTMFRVEIARVAAMHKVKGARY